MKTLLIVDGNNIAHRVRYKFSLSNAGVDVSVTYGFLQVLMSYMRKFTPSAVIVAWDGGLPPFRREKVPSYKANRKHGADDPQEWEDFLRQMNEVRTVSLPLMGVLSFSVRGVEADDLIYHAAVMAPGYDRVIVVSADDDLLQCTRLPNTVIFNPNKKRLLDEDYITKEFGIEPDNFVHWRALQGDSSDNIKGVPGIGPKTATALFKEFGSLMGIINAADGANPTGRITEKKAAAIMAFGIERFAKNTYVMALAFDRTGSRNLLWDALLDWMPADAKQLKRYLMRNAFVSLMEPATYQFAKSLQEPELVRDGLRTPIVRYHRKGV